MKHLCLAVLFAHLFLFAKAQVIVPDESSFIPGGWYCFRNTFLLNEESSNVELRLAADSKYWLWVNGKLEIAEGGLKRGPNPSDSYCDVITSLVNLKKGSNSVVVLVWYFGKDGFSHRNSPTPGITFDLKVNKKTVSCNKAWEYLIHPAYYVPEGVQPNYRLPESNIGFDASKDFSLFDNESNKQQWKTARMLSLSEAGWNNLVDRPIPFWKDYGLKHYEKLEQKGDSLFAYLPYNAQITPYLRIRSAEGKCIKIFTDNYKGGSAPNVFAEYKSKNGEQEFECKGWMNGHYVIYKLDEGVELLDVMYRETGYNTTFAGCFISDDLELNQLWNKAQRTLYITMRDTYMDCPDRERAQWWGDVVNELGESFYALDENAHLLTRKGIRELIGWQRSDSTLFSPVPAGNYDSELPMQMLASISYYGFWTYYMGSGDYETIQDVFAGVKKYIHKWKTDSTGLVIPRDGGWTWGDWGDNKDMTLLFNQWYIIALQGYEKMATLIGEKDEANWASQKVLVMQKVFHQKFWNGKYYISPEYTGEPDDRAQALAIVSGTLPNTLYDTIRPFFMEQYHASPYMEKYVLQSLCMMGFHQDALNRMKFRYNDMIHSSLTTLWEGWGIGSKGFGGGTYNHAWSGGPLTILCQYIAGIEAITPSFEEFKVNPNPASLNYIYTVVPLSQNRAIRMRLNKDNASAVIELEVPEGTKAHLYLPENFTKWMVNNKRKQDSHIVLRSGMWTVKLYH